MFRIVVLAAMAACAFAGNANIVLGSGPDLRANQGVAPLTRNNFGGSGKAFVGNGINNFGNNLVGRDSSFGHNGVGNSRGVIVDPLSRNNANRNSVIGGKGGTLNAFNDNTFADGFTFGNANPYGVNTGVGVSSGNVFGGKNFGADNVFVAPAQNIASAGFNKGNSVTNSGFNGNTFGSPVVFNDGRGKQGLVFDAGVGVVAGVNPVSGGSYLDRSGPFESNTVFGNDFGFGGDVVGSPRVNNNNVYGGFGTSGFGVSGVGINNGFGGKGTGVVGTGLGGKGTGFVSGSGKQVGIGGTGFGVNGVGINNGFGGKGTGVVGTGFGGKGTGFVSGSGKQVGIGGTGFGVNGVGINNGFGGKGTGVVGTGFGGKGTGFVSGSGKQVGIGGTGFGVNGVGINNGFGGKGTGVVGTGFGGKGTGFVSGSGKQVGIGGTGFGPFDTTGFRGNNAFPSKSAGVFGDNTLNNRNNFGAGGLAKNVNSAFGDNLY